MKANAPFKASAPFKEASGAPFKEGASAPFMEASAETAIITAVVEERKTATHQGCSH